MPETGGIRTAKVIKNNNLLNYKYYESSVSVVFTLEIYISHYDEMSEIAAEEKIICIWSP